MEWILPFMLITLAVALGNLISWSLMMLLDTKDDDDR